MLPDGDLKGLEANGLDRHSIFERLHEAGKTTFLYHFGFPLRNFRSVGNQIRLHVGVRLLPAGGDGQRPRVMNLKDFMCRKLSKKNENKFYHDDERFAVIVDGELYLAADVGFRYRPVLPHLRGMDVGFLLVAQKRMEKCDHQVGVHNLRRGVQQRQQKLFHLRQTLLGDGFDVRPPDGDSDLQAVNEWKKLKHLKHVTNVVACLCSLASGN